MFYLLLYAMSVFYPILLSLIVYVFLIIPVGIITILYSKCKRVVDSKSAENPSNNNFASAVEKISDADIFTASSVSLRFPKSFLFDKFLNDCRECPIQARRMHSLTKSLHKVQTANIKLVNEKQPRNVLKFRKRYNKCY